MPLWAIVSSSDRSESTTFLPDRQAGIVYLPAFFYFAFTMYRRLGNFISRYPWVVILFWIALTLVLRNMAPAWDEVTHDGDFAYLPDDCPSVIGQRLLAEAFPYHQSMSTGDIVSARTHSTSAALELNASFRRRLAFR